MMKLSLPRIQAIQLTQKPSQEEESIPDMIHCYRNGLVNDLRTLSNDIKMVLMRNSNIISEETRKKIWEAHLTFSQVINEITSE